MVGGSAASIPESATLHSRPGGRRILFLSPAEPVPPGLPTKTGFPGGRPHSHPCIGQPMYRKYRCRGGQGWPGEASNGLPVHSTPGPAHFCGGSRTGLKNSIRRLLDSRGTTRRRVKDRLPLSEPPSAAVVQGANGQEVHLRPCTAGCRVRPTPEDSGGEREARRAGEAGSRSFTRCRVCVIESTRRRHGALARVIIAALPQPK